MRVNGLAVIIAAALAIELGSGAHAQNNNGQDNNVIVVPPAPLIVAAPASIPSQPLPPPAAPPPGLVVTPVPPINTDNGTAGDGGLSPLPGQPAAPANNWIAGTTAKLGVLDRIDGTVSEITISSGGQANVGDLRITVQTCMIRPPDQIPDAAIFLTAQAIADESAPPLYRGWMVRSVPGAAVVGDTSETFRVIGCS